MTAAISRRVEKLESGTGRRTRLIVIRSGGGHTADDVAQTLKHKGIAKTSADTVIRFQTIYLDREGNDVPAGGPPEISVY